MFVFQDFQLFYFRSFFLSRFSGPGMHALPAPAVCCLESTFGEASLWKRKGVWMHCAMVHSLATD